MSIQNATTSSTGSWCWVSHGSYRLVLHTSFHLPGLAIDIAHISCSTQVSYPHNHWMISQSVVKPVKRIRIDYLIHIMKWLKHNIEYMYIYYQYLKIWYMYSFMWPVYICIHLYAFTFLARLAINTSLSFVSAQPMLASAMRPDMFFAGVIFDGFARSKPRRKFRLVM